ncbi:MAG: DUF5606 domain-containing protein [Flavobacteriales bacterium]|nr:DUF5606 domain-containing protein [Flavobacteriales bacterium]
MDLSGIISISGRPGLYKVIAQGKNSIIVESITEKKRFPAYATDRISALEDISIYTYEGDRPLKEIFADIYEKQDGKEAPSHKEDMTILLEFVSEIIPNYDEERVYPSDIKKLIQWYNMLLKSGNLEPSEEEAEEETTPEAKEEEATEKKEEKKETKKSGEKKKPAAKKKSEDK